ncbi:UNVERIFIED_CONTAM: hypothetical protein DES50_101331 [Williamsia faeni]
MARGMDPESRPISVAELLARAKEQGADDVAGAVGSSPAATGRRRRGGKDGVSVAELTGEMPRVTAQPKADETSQPKADETSEPKADEAPEPKADEALEPKADEAQQSNDKPAEAEVKAAPTTPPSPTPPPTRDFSSAAVSKRATAEAEPTVKPTPGAPDRPAPLSAKPAAAEPPSDSADAPADPDEETTGVIPSMQAYSQVDSAGDDDHRVLSAAERERDFERYRNFEDVETEGDAATGTKKKKKRGLFGFGRRTVEASTPDAGGDPGDNSDHTATQFIPKVADDARAPETSGPPEPEPASEPKTAPEPAPVPAPREQAGAVAAATDRYLRFDLDDDADTDTAKSVEVADESPTSQLGRVRDTDAPDAPVVDLDKNTGDAPISLSKPVADSSDSVRDTGTEGEQSPTVQWLLLIGQVLAGLAVGVALFWGFTELWRWNVLFALVLSVAVIFGLVTLVHVVRRSNDLISTLLALGVGLLVTIGPLVLLLIAGD